MSTNTRPKKERIKRIHDSFVALTLIVKRRFAQRLQSFGVTQPQFMTLAALTAHQKACTMSDLTDVTFQDAPTMTGIINRLVKMKLVQRTRSETDRRVVLVQIAPAGSELVKQIDEKIFHDDLSGYADLTDDDLTALEQLLRYLLRMYVGQYKSLEDAHLDAEIEKLQHFVSDPIRYIKLEDEKNTPAVKCEA